jgi:hypothetical protein
MLSNCLFYYGNTRPKTLDHSISKKQRVGLNHSRAKKLPGDTFQND